MTMPNLNDLDGLEFTRADVICFILNILGYLILGFDQMMWILITSVLSLGILLIIVFCLGFCCRPDSRQAVFAPFGREHYD